MILNWMSNSIVFDLQSSWTKHAVEDDSPQQMSPSDPWADPYDSTCAQVIHSKQGMPKSTNQGCQEQREAAGTTMLHYFDICYLCLLIHLLNNFRIYAVL